MVCSFSLSIEGFEKEALPFPPGRYISTTKDTKYTKGKRGYALRFFTFVTFVLAVVRLFPAVGGEPKKKRPVFKSDLVICGELYS
jgi:hypothetical protein